MIQGHPDQAHEIWRSCTRFLSHHYPRTPRDTLLALADEAGDEGSSDTYGTGDMITSFEQEIAELLGKEEAVFLPSGTMAQQIALRLWTDKRGVPSVAMHPRNHLDRHEAFGYQLLHRLRGIPVGFADELLTLTDLQSVAEPIGAVLLELPQREIGGRLPEWNELVELTAWVRERGIPLHMDGARLWECGPYYNGDYAEIAGLFDSAYVSFYKGLGGIAGSALAGPSDLIAESRVWQRRHGGNIIRLYPYVLSARRGIREHLPRMEEYHERAQQIADVLRDVGGIDVVPDPPPTTMMHLHLRGDREQLRLAALDISRETGVWLLSRVAPTPVPSTGMIELTVGEATLDLSLREIRDLFEDLMKRARS